MYWPLGAPSVYEQSLFETTHDISYDGQAPVAEKGDDLISGPLEGLKLHNESKSEGAKVGAAHDAAAHAPAQERAALGNQSSSRAHGNDSSQDAGPHKAKQRSHRNAIVSVASSRNGNTFATITKQALVIWSSRPCVLLSSITRSLSSLETYGVNVSVLMRPDAAILVVQTSKGYLITYSLNHEPGIHAYQLAFVDSGRHGRRRSATQTGRKDRTSIHDDGPAVDQLTLRFRMVIKVDAGIAKVLALDDELVVATAKPAAIQCIRWVPDQTRTQTNTALFSRLTWITSKGPAVEMVYDKPMNLYAWIFDDGRAYAVQRSTAGVDKSKPGRAVFNGHLFHDSEARGTFGRKAAINSRFSTIALGCADGSVQLYNVRDYLGGIVLLKQLQSPASVQSTGNITVMRFSPDGYYLFVGYEKGWASWTVLGLQSASSFSSDLGTENQAGTDWLNGVLDAFWIGGGSELVLFRPQSISISVLEFVRSALISNLSSANVSKPLLQTSTGIMVYQGHSTPDLTTISADVSLWHQSQVPSRYVDEQWPLRSSAISPDGRYVAVAGQRGLAHYSVNSGRWKVFEDELMQNSFRVRGGMCWHQHILIAAVETDDSYEVRLYSREAPLEDSKMLQQIRMNAPVVHLATSCDDSILVYTYENVLEHYVVVSAKKSVQLAKVGQIGLHGIIRAPARVRAVSWVVPDHQLQSGDPSKDVAVASMLLLVDAKLVLLQPTTNDEGELKYDMRVIAHNVEFYFLARDSPNAFGKSPRSTSQERKVEEEEEEEGAYRSVDESNDSLQDSLWLFDGQDIRTWTDVQSLLESAPTEYSRDFPSSIATTVDFYPLSVLIHRGIVFGAEAELIRGREDSFTLFRMVARASLFIPDILRYQLTQYDSSGALHLSHRYQKLPYLPHALEVLLHNVLDDEVEAPPQADTALLPTVLSFLSSFEEYLDVVVQCTRKTEVRSWDTLFSHLPPPLELFDASLEKGALKTASGYLLVLHTLTDIQSTSPQVIKLLRAAKETQDWELCKELARFLMALDESGATLEYALDLVDLPSPTTSRLPAGPGLGLTNYNGAAPSMTQTS